MAWSPGHRRVPPGVRTAGKSLRIMGTMANLVFKLYENPATPGAQADIEDDTPIEEGPNFSIVFQRSSSHFIINLSEFTTEELDALQKCLADSFTAAREITELRDKIAKEASENGDTVYFRSLRPAPKVSVIKRREQ